MHLLRLRQWRTSVPWLLLLAIAAASTMPQTVSARLNQHTCHPEDISLELTDSHMKLYLLSLPEHLADKAGASCSIAAFVPVQARELLMPGRARFSLCVCVTVQVLALCGTWHRLHLDAMIVSDINPYGQPVRYKSCEI